MGVPRLARLVARTWSRPGYRCVAGMSGSSSTPRTLRWPPPPRGRSHRPIPQYKHLLIFRTAGHTPHVCLPPPQLAQKPAHNPKPHTVLLPVPFTRLWTARHPVRWTEDSAWRPSSSVMVTSASGVQCSSTTASTLPPPSIWSRLSRAAPAGLKTKWRPVGDATTNADTKVLPAGYKTAWEWAASHGLKS